MIEAIALGTFVFVSLAVGGVRALAVLEKHRQEQAREPEITEYTGPLWSHRGRRIR